MSNSIPPYLYLDRSGGLIVDTKKWLKSPQHHHNLYQTEKLRKELLKRRGIKQ